ncbi:nucleotidyltransferase family protein [Kytococcus sedentarius]|uniref:Predicted nucleotidyltransferase n=1 Tax=Kytococcus sedentarius (strain ATCC 14392 / DSM 20547 / JCM 11482 / CCUG 33030 / NBRC 15357 / NCTC 11040 / CCM 314 / 541) TaxID=478801 RepID=C7NGE6_KYTSD|nr:nucleotidyltransferase family protein [Kytococcus sedentarius]ACV06054.1 predicted nucleotidyltransferase [Kytococcus sedentarius DSM 20547]QQB64423.1 nucleotidyltransferase family protein [Kytococcus sedentarius]STX12528.1 Predicted nucleotidyltransferase [Kytococcus sedentarius]
MSVVTVESEALRDLLRAHRLVIDQLLHRYGATHPRLIGSVSRGDATAASDIDLMVDLLPGHGNPLLRVAGLSEELTEALGHRVDVVTPDLLRENVSLTALRDARPL